MSGSQTGARAGTLAVPSSPDAHRVPRPPAGPATARRTASVKEPDSRRSPKPTWQSALPDRPRSLGTAVAEPVAAGVWLRPAGEDGLRDAHRTRLSTLPVSAGPLVVVGVPGAPALPVADVARLWQGLPPGVRPTVRFLCYGPARLSGGRHLGDVLAQVLGEPVRLYNGLPGDGEVLRVAADGSPGRPLLGQQFVHLPPAAASAGPPPSPFAVAHRWPLDGLEETGPGTYRLADDAVVEVVRSGLWVRGPQDPPYAAEVRAGDPEPGRERILCDARSEEALPRLRQLAADLVGTFPPELRRAVRLGVCRPSAPAARAGRAPARPAPRPGGHTGEARRTAVADTGDEGFLSVAGTGDEGFLSVAAEILRRHPDLTPDPPGPDAVTGLAAVLRRLARTPEPDGTGPDGTPGPPGAEPLRAGLRLLPVHRGATGLRATLDEAMRQWYAGQPLVVDADACEASAVGPGTEPGNTDFLIWSVDGRRTDLLDPLSPHRVLFLPGSRFRVLGPGVPGVVMMREIGPGEAEQDPELDRAAVRELTRARRNWQGGNPA
ncbi:hypothetical protein KBP30_14525 [Streptomyces sp. Go40/10]|uniref:hypothetical protein n=1 Tax=Streptomyces sp. Go40/10 TaxID=2825844 RepID=UPI001E53A04A|nr:hypothetical protein [Streptomyces sp. Go40/10]UFR02322.1 hypothetical protein KBP30_14525 [Streptomyces sp. Go40/10]